MRLVWTVAVVFCACLSPTAAAAAEDTGGLVPIRVGVEQGNPADARQMRAWFGEGRCPPVDGGAWIEAGPASRLEAEMVILCNALIAAGGSYRIELTPTYNYNRGKADAEAGRIDLPSQSLWEDEVDPELLLATDPVIAPGEWTVGLFTAASREDVLAAGSVGEIRAMTAAVPRTWHHDWSALERLGLSGLIDVQENGLIPRMIADGRVDFTLDAFGGPPDFARVSGPERIVMRPIPGFRVAIAAGRRFAVSRTRSDAAEVVAAINRGLGILRERGAIRQALQQAGFFRPGVSGWTVVGPPEG